ncbi:hypothetical protein SDJN02_11264, partial [Cucurbita argyrosperma subsp. argyrosperma]
MKGAKATMSILSGNLHKAVEWLDARRTTSENFDPKNLLRLFLWAPETKKLLTVQEESELIVQIQQPVWADHDTTFQAYDKLALSTII